MFKIKFVVVTSLFLSLCAPSAVRAYSADFAERVVIGISATLKPIVASRYGTGSDVVVVVGAIHGNEVSSSVVARYISRSAVPSGFSLWVVEVANPDGFAAGKRTRGNANGVDLNRNFPTGWLPLDCPGRNCAGPAPASESETRALMLFFTTVKPSLVVFYHSSVSPSVLDVSRGDVHDYGKAKRYAAAAGIRMGNVSCGSACSGTATQYINETIDTATSFVVELTCDGLRCLSSSVVKRHVRAFWSAA